MTFTLRRGLAAAATGTASTAPAPAPFGYPRQLRSRGFARTGA
jgi:hypothetical protein